MPGVQPKSRDKRNVIFVVIILGVLCITGFPSFFFLYSFREAQHQHKVYQTYVPVDAKVISSDVSRYHTSRGGTHYSPDVTYQYTVDGISYQSSELRAVYVWGDQDWANDIVARYRPGLRCRAFYDPSKPDQAVLIRGYSFSPYFDMLEAAFCLAGGLPVVLGAWFSRKRDPVPAEAGWYKFFPEYSQEQHLSLTQLSTVLWYGLGAVTAVHFFHFVPAPHSSYSLHVLMIFAALGLIPAGLVLRYYRVTHYLGPPRLLLDRSAAVPGQEFKFTVSQQGLRPLTLSSVNVWLHCTATIPKGSSQRIEPHKQQPIALRNHVLRAGEPLELSGALTIPSGLPATGRDTTHARTWINWDITLECKIRGGPVYETKFPILVAPAPVATGVLSQA